MKKKRAMKIAILAWGSLLWDEEANREFDKWRKRWRYDGPTLKIQFSKISKSRQGALTLVIDLKHGVPTTVAWCLSKRQKLEDAVADLRCREGTAIENIGYIRVEKQSAPPNPFDAKAAISTWARERKLDSVVWTALESDFEKKTRTPFSLEAVVAYLKELTPAAKAKAAEYVWRAPDFVQTPVRSALQEEPWFAKPGS